KLLNVLALPMLVPRKHGASWLLFMIPVCYLNPPKNHQAQNTSIFSPFPYEISFYKDSYYRDNLLKFAGPPGTKGCEPKWANEAVRVINEKRALHSSPPL